MTYEDYITAGTIRCQCYGLSEHYEHCPIAMVAEIRRLEKELQKAVDISYRAHNAERQTTEKQA